MSKPTVPEVLPQFLLYCERHPGGGSLHIVLMDYNIDTSHVEFCRDYARERGDGEGEHLAGLLLAMSKTQRLKVAHACPW